MCRWDITDNALTMRKVKFIISYTLALLLCSTLFSACGSLGGFGGAGGSLWGYGAKIENNHQKNLDVIEKNYRECLASAQTKADSTICEENHQDALNEEKSNYDDARKVLKAKEDYVKYQLWVLEIWGYSKEKSNDVTKRLIKMKGDDFEFDGVEAISELIKEGYKDKVAIEKFENELPNYGVSKDNAEQVAKEYYENEYYTRDNSIKEPYFYLVGNSVYCNRKMLVDMGLIDDGGESDNDGEGEGDDEGGENNNGTNPGNPTPNPQPKPTPSLYQVESNEITNYSVSQYKLDKVRLTKEQIIELDKVVTFMKKWPDAKIAIVGHTCSIGSDAVNNRVGLHRAHQAKLYMVSQGIDESRIEEVSKAASEPVTGNDTEKGRLQNRRITFIVK